MLIPEDIQAIFGYVLRRLRMQKGLSQETLAYRSGLSRSFIASIELGKRNPTIVSLLRLAHGLEIRPSQIIVELEKELETVE